LLFLAGVIYLAYFQNDAHFNHQFYMYNTFIAALQTVMLCL